jgi:hypothetical protein
MFAAVLQSHSARRYLALVGLLFAVVCRLAFAADDEKKKPTDADLALRPYRNGPLTAADYRCPPPNPAPQKNGVALAAMTYTSVHYNIRYRWREVKPSKVEARLTMFDIVAEVDRRQSWNTRPTDDRLLDHEQGHFDVTELWARKIQKKFNELISSGAIVGHGDDEASASADLNQQVDSRVQELLDLEHKQQDQYDVATHHGTYHKSQAEERQKQIAALHEKTPPPVKESSP